MAMPQPERTLTLLIAATRLRISECLGLQWKDIDYANQPSGGPATEIQSR